MRTTCPSKEVSQWGHVRVVVVKQDFCQLNVVLAKARELLLNLNKQVLKEKLERKNGSRAYQKSTVELLVM
jgi:hypothetical protein